MEEKSSDSRWSDTAREFLSDLSLPQANPTQPVIEIQVRTVIGVGCVECGTAVGDYNLMYCHWYEDGGRVAEQRGRPGPHWDGCAVR